MQYPLDTGTNRLHGDIGDCLITRGGIDDLQHLLIRHIRRRFLADAAANLVFPLAFHLVAHQGGSDLPFLALVELGAALLVNQRRDNFPRQIFRDTAIGSATGEQSGERE